MTNSIEQTRQALRQARDELRTVIEQAENCPGFRRQLRQFGCRLLHWDPSLENFRSRHGHQIYQPLNVRTGGRSHFAFDRVYKIRYPQPGQPRNADDVPERQYGLTYSDLTPKEERAPLLEGFKSCATRLGAIVGQLQAPLERALPGATLNAKQDLHRWIFTVYDFAWQAPRDHRCAATKYIPVEGLDDAMQSNEALEYDADAIRCLKWRKAARLLDPTRRNGFQYLQDTYEQWRNELPIYYASRIDNIMESSDAAIDWLLNRLAEERLAEEEQEQK